MAKFLLSAMPFSGHVAPLAAVAEALVARGHDVRIYTGSRFRTRVEAAGARLVPWERAPDFDENDMSATFPRMVGRKGMRQLLINVADCFIRTAPTQVDDLAAEWRRERWDALAADEVSIGAVLFSLREKRPWSTVAVLPLNLPGSAGPPSGMGIVPGTTPLTRARDALLRGAVPVISMPLARPLARAHRAVGLAPDGLTMDALVFSRSLIIASGAPVLDYGRADRPDQLRFVGELHGAPVPQPMPQWWSELDGRRVVVVTQGTQNIDPEDLLHPALQALAERDVLVVATTGVRGRDTLPFPVPRNARVAGFVPFDALLPRAELVVTNGGWGGTLAALGQGIPVVIAGGDLDKPEVAARVAWSGAGVNLRTGTPTARQVGDAVGAMLTDGSFRVAAQRVAEALRALGGAARAAELLEAALSGPEGGCAQASNAQRRATEA